MNDSIIFLKLLQVCLRKTVCSLFKKHYSCVQYVMTFTRNNFESLLLGMNLVVSKPLFFWWRGWGKTNGFYLKGIINTFSTEHYRNSKRIQKLEYKNSKVSLHFHKSPFSSCLGKKASLIKEGYLKYCSQLVESSC